MRKLNFDSWSQWALGARPITSNQLQSIVIAKLNPFVDPNKSEVLSLLIPVGHKDGREFLEYSKQSSEKFNLDFAQEFLLIGEINSYFFLIKPGTNKEVEGHVTTNRFFYLNENKDQLIDLVFIQTVDEHKLAPATESIRKGRDNVWYNENFPMFQ